MEVGTIILNGEKIEGRAVCCTVTEKEEDQDEEEEEGKKEVFHCIHPHS